MPKAGVQVMMFVATAAEWAVPHEILEENWIGIESDTGKMKLGDGVRRWIDLPYIVTGGTGGPSGSNILFKDEGTIIGSAPTIESVNFIGAGVNAYSGGSEVTVSIAGGGTGGPGAGEYLGPRGNVDLGMSVDSSYSNGLPGYSPLSISNVSGVYTQPAIFTPGGFHVLEMVNQIATTGSSVNIAGIYNYMEIGGTHTSGNVFGSQHYLFPSSSSTANFTAIAGTVYAENGVGAAIGGQFSVVKGNINSTAVLKGIVVLATHAYSSTTTLAGGEFTIAGGHWMGGGYSIGSAKILRLRANGGTGDVAWQDLRGISMDGWDWPSGSVTCTNSYGIYIDASIDKGATRYCIYSLSTSPSRFSGVINNTATGISAFSGPISVLDEGYGPAWNSSTQVPTKNAVYDKIESLILTGGTTIVVGAPVTGGTVSTVLYKDNLGNLASNAGFIYNGGIDLTSPASTITLKLAGTQLTPPMATGYAADAPPVLDVTGAKGQDCSQAVTGEADAGDGSSIYLRGGEGGAHTGGGSLREVGLIGPDGPTTFARRGVNAGAGGFVWLLGGQGGIASNTAVDATSGAGGGVNLICGNGGIPGAGFGGAGGGGGSVTINSGYGGAGPTGAGGGGYINLRAGDGGTSPFASKGTLPSGGVINIISGVGGISTGPRISGLGGLIKILANTGGACATAGGTAGMGGSIEIDAGAAGVATPPAIPNPSGNGSITIGGTNAKLINVGNTSAAITWSADSIKIGISSVQKIGFYGIAPIVQPVPTGEVVGFSPGAGTTVTDQSTFTGNVGSSAYRINDIVKALKQLGLLAQ